MRDNAEAAEDRSIQREGNSAPARFGLPADSEQRPRRRAIACTAPPLKPHADHQGAGVSGLPSTDRTAMAMGHSAPVGRQIFGRLA